MSTYKPSEVSVAIPLPPPDDSLFPSSLFFAIFRLSCSPFSFPPPPFPCICIADKSTTVLSKTALLTSGSLPSTVSEDRESLDDFFIAHCANLSDGPDPHVEGAKGGKASGSTGESYKPSEHDGLKKDGTEDKRTSSEHGFGGS